MVDTIKTKTELVTAYADNSSRAVTAQTHRDGLVSHMSCTAQLHTPVAPLVLGVVAVPVVFTVSNALSGGVTPDAAWAYLDIAAGGDGIYLMSASVSVQPAAINTGVTLGVMVNTVLVRNIVTDFLPAITDIHNLGFSVLLDQLVATDRVQLVIGTTAGTPTIVYHDGHFALARQAGTPIS